MSPMPPMPPPPGGIIGLRVKAPVVLVTVEDLAGNHRAILGHDLHAEPLIVVARLRTQRIGQRTRAESVTPGSGYASGLEL
jgi:hypothetical protein